MCLETHGGVQNCASGVVEGIPTGVIKGIRTCSCVAEKGTATGHKSATEDEDGSMEGGAGFDLLMGDFSFACLPPYFKASEVHAVLGKAVMAVRQGGGGG